MRQAMSREGKISEFLSVVSEEGRLRWCDGGQCACMGCVNGSERVEWTSLHPEESPITKSEFEKELKLMEQAWKSQAK